MIKKLLILCLLVVSSICMAQYSSHQLYQAYLNNDMTIWQQYIASAHWDEMTSEEQKKLLNYEYGFTAYCLSYDKNRIQSMIKQYEQHLHASKDIISEADYLSYLSGLYSYKLSLDQSKALKYGCKIFDNIKQAVILEPNNPFVLFMQGNLEFYNPFGSKKKALEYFQRAENMYQQMPDAYELWNLRTVQMTIVQCLDKLGHREAACKQCEQYLAEEPNSVIFQQLLVGLK